MEQTTYERLSSVVSKTSGGCLNVPVLRSKFPGLALNTLNSIVSQEAQHNVIKTNHVHKAHAQTYAERYKAGEDLLELSSKVCFPPCMLMRRLLEALIQAPKQVFSELMRNPESLTGLSAAAGLSATLVDRLQRDITRAALADANYSPYADLLKQASGLEYELLLSQELTSAGVPFWTEADLRLQGLHKTPDARLKVPMSVLARSTDRGRGLETKSFRVVNWIDSKATFGDLKTHTKQLDDQYRTYVNRYGPGLVIYWFGHLAELPPDPDVLVMDHFPRPEELLTLTSLSMGHAD